MFSYVKDLSIRDDLFLEETLYDIPLFNPFQFSSVSYSSLWTSVIL